MNNPISRPIYFSDEHWNMFKVVVTEGNIRVFKKVGRDLVELRPICDTEFAAVPV